MNFRHDFAEMARDELTNYGIDVSKDWSDDSVSLQFFQIKRRHFNSNIPYYVLYSQELLNKFPNLSPGDQAAIRDIEFSLKTCQTIEPYMSKGINALSIKKSDFMLKNWGIYHLHLEKAVIYKAYTNPNLLFFQAKGQVVHFIDVKPHPKGSGWFDRELLETIYQNWPNLLNFQKGLIPTETIEDKDVHKITKNFVTFVPFHGGALIPSNLGVASSGDSIEAVRMMDNIFNRFALWEKQIEKDEENIRVEINRLHHPMPEKLNFSLIIEDNYFVAYEDYAQLKIRMFAIPRLLQSVK